MSRNSVIDSPPETLAASMPMKDQCSPFFHKKRVISTHPYSRSDFFPHGPSSAVGAVKSLGSLLFCLVCDRHGNANDRDDYELLSVKSLEILEHEALSHFQCCSFFMDLWNECTKKSKANDIEGATDITLAAQVRRLDDRLSFRARHLCQHLCFMRAFAPYRDWHSLRVLLADHFTTSPVDSILSGWSCHLVPDPAKLPRTVFRSPQGQHFCCKQQVVKVLCSRERRTGRKRPRYPASAASYFLTPSSPHGVLHPLYDPASSPFGLLEELFTDDPWALLLSTILLNRTTRVQVDSVMHRFLQQWPNYEAVLKLADDAKGETKLAATLQPLGMNLRRAHGILRFCKDYKALLEDKRCREGAELNRASCALTRDEVLSLFHCGTYAYTAYRLFVRREVEIEPTDRFLCVYADYQRGLEISRRNFVH